MFAGNIYHHRTSAQSGYGIEQCFNQLITKIWANLNQQHFDKSGQNLSVYSGSVQSQDQDSLFQFKPIQARQKMRKSNLLSTMDNQIDGTHLKVDAIFDDENSKDLHRRNNVFQKNSISQDNGLFGFGDQSFKLKKIDHQKFYKRYNQEQSGCCTGGGGGIGGCCANDVTEKNLMD